MKHILLTGATGVLGSQVLYELLQDKLLEKKDVFISVLVRPRKNEPSKERIEKLFSEKLLPAKLQSFTSGELLKNIDVISGSIEEFEFTPKAPLILIHSAASVSLDSKKSTQESIKKDNYEATLNLAKRFSAWENEQFIYVSTAYCCGVQHGQVTNDYLGMNIEDLTFRNAYEEYKFKAEQSLLELSKENNFTLKIARPSIICGRLVEEPKYVMNRYIVYYLMGKFFKDIKRRAIDMDQEIRLQASEGVTINIIPVDYVAKAITRLIDATGISQLNIVNTNPFPVKEVIKKALTQNGFTNFVLVDEEPEDKSFIERIFYSTVALQLVQYVGESHHTFDTKMLRNLMQDIPEPDIAKNYDVMMDFAHERNYEN